MHTRGGWGNAWAKAPSLFTATAYLSRVFRCSFHTGKFLLLSLPRSWNRRGSHERRELFRTPPCSRRQCFSRGYKISLWQIFAGGTDQRKFFNTKISHTKISRSTVLTSEGVDDSETQEIKFKSSGILFEASAVLPEVGSDIHIIKTLIDKLDWNNCE